MHPRMEGLYLADALVFYFTHHIQFVLRELQMLL